MRPVENSTGVYRAAHEGVRRQLNRPVLEELLVRAGQILWVRYNAPFELVFGLPEFEHRSLERETGVSRSGTTYSAVEVRYRLAE